MAVDDAVERARHRRVGGRDRPRSRCEGVADLPQLELRLLAQALIAERGRHRQQRRGVNRDEHQLGARCLGKRLPECRRVSSLGEAVDTGGYARDHRSARAGAAATCWGGRGHAVLLWRSKAGSTLARAGTGTIRDRPLSALRENTDGRRPVFATEHPVPVRRTHNARSASGGLRKAPLGLASVNYPRGGPQCLPPPLIRLPALT